MLPVAFGAEDLSLIHLQVHARKFLAAKLADGWGNLLHGRFAGAAAVFGGIPRWVHLYTRRFKYTKNQIKSHDESDNDDIRDTRSPYPLRVTQRWCSQHKSDQNR
jgi:hypothetical protein